MRVTICLLFSISLLASCVRESLPECPYQYNIQLVVKDKNYLNNSGTEGNIVDENLPFNQYISNIYYTLENIKTGNTNIKSPINKILGEEKNTNIILDHMPDGQYLLTVWGNVNESVIETLALHTDNTESTDIYLGSAILNIINGLAQDTILGMDRTKGKLSVKMNNLPESIVKIDQNISNIYKYVNAQRLYRDMANVKTTFRKSTQVLDKTSTYLAPTLNNEISKLTISFYTTDNSSPTLTLPSIDLEINRNDITEVTVNYNSTQDEIEIWVYIDSEWTLVKKLNISEIEI